MAKKIIYAALPVEDVENMFDMLESTAQLMDGMVNDPGVTVATQTTAREAADAIRIKVRALRLKVQTL